MAEPPSTGSFTDPTPLQRHQSFGPSLECKLCDGMTLETLASPNGYPHAPDRKSLFRSAKTCKLCSYIFRKGGLSRDAALVLRLGKLKTGEVNMIIEHVGTSSQVSDGSRKRNIKIKVFAMADDPALAYGVSLKYKLTNTASDESFDFALNRLKHCIEHHDCGTPLPLEPSEGASPLSPARLIDIAAFKGSPDVKLVDNQDTSRIYIALSYCWGKSRPCITTTESLGQRQERIAFDGLPRTFRDLITIARRLDVRFVWIDALSIIQDDELDWQREAAKMGAIYSKAYCTIAADASSDSDGGCFNLQSVSQESFQDQTPFELRLASNQGHRSTLFLWNPVHGTWRSSHPEIDASPLSERGWVCQERILSPRILHFTSTQIFWECRHSLSAEDGLQSEDNLSSSLTVARNNYGPSLARQLYRKTRSLLSPFDSVQQPVMPLLVAWYNSVIAASYSRRHLTKPDDKLLAISGVARVFDHHLSPSNVKYVAGLWMSDPHRHDLDMDAAAKIVAQGLSWQRKGPISRPVAYRAPSFSWAAIDAQVEWPVQLGGVSNIASSQNTFQETLDAAIEVLDVRINCRDGNDRFGRIAEGSYLELNGYLSNVTIIARKKLGFAPAPPLSTPTILRTSLSNATVASTSSEPPNMSMSVPGLRRSTSGAMSGSASVSVIFTWEAHSSTQKWGGTAYLDDDPSQPIQADKEEQSEVSPLQIEDGMSRIVEALLLEKEHHGGRSRLLLIEPFAAGAGHAATLGQAAVEFGTYDLGDDSAYSPILAYRRIGIAVFDGYDDASSSGSVSQSIIEQSDQEMTRLRIF